MLKEEKVLHPMFITHIDGGIIDRGGDMILGSYCDDSDFASISIYPTDVLKELSGKDYYFAQVSSSGSFCDGHVAYNSLLTGVLLAFNIDESLYHIEPNIYKSEGWIKEEELVNNLTIYLESNNLMGKKYGQKTAISIQDEGYVRIIIPDKTLDAEMLETCDSIGYIINKYYNQKYSKASGKQFLKNIHRNT